jgi:EAL domain-containing protein (putative c-di-GMP-specific phosphodiesterase class I)
VCCAEALARWRHPERGNVPPDQFIAIAEQTGLIHDLTRWVLDRALEECAGWQRAGYAFGVAVNISAANLRDPNLAGQVDSALRKWGVPAAMLMLELTESAIMSDADHALEVLSQLDTMGVRLSIDDFGTGYSSLSYLKQLPVDEIKIDRSFVMDMKLDKNDAIIVRSTIDLAHNMGLSVVAEGVENEDTLTLLGTLGCDLAQGYHISRPVPYETFLGWLARAPRCDREKSGAGKPADIAPGRICYDA